MGLCSAWSQTVFDLATDPETVFDLADCVSMSYFYNVWVPVHLLTHSKWVNTD